jgi:ERF superfamily
MPRTSESVAALASALAKAQAELVNPEKSLTATIRHGRAGEGEERSFRYAPLSSGLDIVRKTLGQHEIATMQTTAIDQVAGLVNLTTMLAHASGEWIASDWPVCAIADMASPRRMGAALTYARRYALFTLVGIAGEDDLDAPDLLDGANASLPCPSTGAAAAVSARGDTVVWSQSRPATTKRAAPVILVPDKSAALRDRLVGEVAGIASAEQAASWARGALVAKNSLTAVDARVLEDVFERRLSELAQAATFAEQAHAGSVDDQTAASPPPFLLTATADVASGDGKPSGIDKSALALPEPKRYRNKEHLRFVAQQACLICARKPSDPHHLRFTQPRALGRKVSDEFVVPLCRSHHRALHRVGDERAWWKAAGIEPVKAARKLWRRTRLAEGQDRHPVVLEQVGSEQAATGLRLQSKSPAPKSINAGGLQADQDAASAAGSGRVA